MSDDQASSTRTFLVPDLGWKAIAIRLWRRSGDDRLSLLASGIAFNTFLAFVPLLTSVVLTYGIFAAPEQVAGHLAMLTDMLPEQAADFIGNQLESMVMTASSAAGFGLLATLGLALYGALRGSSGIISALNAVFDVEESRSFVWQTLASIVITLGLVLAFLVASAGISLVAFLSAILPDLSGVLNFLLQAGYWLTAAIGVSVVIALIYRYAPNREDAQWRWLTAGSALATLVWLAATWIFGFYVRNFGSFGALYGTIGAVIVLLIWLYISAYILLLGAELNRILAESDGQARD